MKSLFSKPQSQYIILLNLSRFFVIQSVVPDDHILTGHSSIGNMTGVFADVCVFLIFPTKSVICYFQLSIEHLPSIVCDYFIYPTAL